MEYVYIPQPPKEKEQEAEKPKCPLSTDHHWAISMENRGYFLSARHALEFLESNKPLMRVSTDDIFTNVSIKSD